MFPRAHIPCDACHIKVNGSRVFFKGQDLCHECFFKTPVGSRIKAAVDKAEEGFWASIAADFPEATTGDYDGNDYFYQNVITWLQFNTNLIPEE